MDLNSIAQSGKDPKTGRYLSPEERKAAFRKSLGKKVDGSSKYVSAKKNPVSTKRGGGSSDGGGGALAKKYNFKVIEKLIGLKKVADELLKTKQERVRLESKFAAAQKIAQDRENKKKEESKMESGSSDSGKNIFSSFASKAAAKAGGGLFGILKSIIAYGILDWISKPENKATVESFVKVFMGIFKFFNMFVGTMVDSLLGGFTRLFGGGSILERVFGGLQLIFGIFLFKGFTRVLNPLKLIGDIKWAIKNAKNFKNLFGSLFSKNLKGVGDAIKQIFPKTASIFKKGLQGALKRVFLKVFGKGIFTFLKPFVKTITRTLVRPLAKAVTKVPVIGTLLAIPINMFLGDPIDKAAVKAIGAGLGTFVVGALGSVVPGAGTVLGGLAGGLLGDFLAGWLYDTVLAPLGKTLFGGKKDQPQMNSGGIASGPDTGYDVTLHGTEAVIPIDKLKDIVLMPYKTVASIIIGSTLAVLKSMGAVGSVLAPIALQMFNPFIKIFGISVETFSSGLGKGADLLMSPASAKEPDIRDRDPRAKGGYDPRYDTGGTPEGTPPPDDTNPSPPPTSTESGQWGPVLDLIAREESGGNFEAMAPGTKLPGATKMTIAEVAKRATGAVGKWQNLPEYLIGRAKAVGLDPNKDLYNQENQRKIAEYLIGPGQGGVSVDLAKKDPKKAMFKLSKVWAAIPKDDSGVSYYAGVGNNAAHIKPSEMYDAFKKLDIGGKVEDPGVLRLFDKKGRDVKNTAPGHSIGGILEFASGGIIQSAKKAVAEGRRGPASPPCASWVRMVLGMAGHPAAQKTTKKGDLDPDGTAYSGPNFAASFAGSDMGAVIRSQSALQPGDVVLHQNTYGSFTPGAVTHVSIASDKPGKILHQSTSGGAPKEGGIWNFKAGIRLGGSGTVGGSDQESGTTPGSSTGSGGSTTAEKTTPPEPAVSDSDLKYLLSALTGGQSSGEPPSPPPTTPTKPAPNITVTPRPSALPSMSSQFSLDKKMSAAHGIQTPTSIINYSETNLGASININNLNNKTITETANLNLL